VKSSPFVGYRGDPDPAAVTRDDALHGCQPNTVPRKFAQAVGPLKGAKKLIGASPIQAYAVVAHVAYSFALFRFLAAEFDGSLLLLAAKLPGIVEQVLQGNAQQTAITTNNTLLGYRYGNRACRIALL
jgi:hypothetical protein